MSSFCMIVQRYYKAHGVGQETEIGMCQECLAVLLAARQTVHTHAGLGLQQFVRGGHLKERYFWEVSEAIYVFWRLFRVS